MLFKCRAKHVLCVIWDVEFDGDTHFPIWPEERSTAGQTMSNRSNFKIQSFLSKTWLICADLTQDFENVILFVRQLEMHFKYVTSSTLPVFWPLHRQKQRYCLEILFTYCLYVSQSHILRFFENFPGFWKYLKKSKFLVENSQDIEIFLSWKFRDSSFLCQAFLCLWPDFGVSTLLIWFSAFFSY